MPKTGVMVCGHGSRDADAVREFLALSEGLRPRLPDYDLEIGFLEFARPVIREGLEALVHRGNRRILAVPGMLFAAGHVKNDVPSEINEFAHAHPGIEIRLGRDLAIDARLLQAARERIESVLGDDEISSSRIVSAAVSASPGVSANSTPPAFMRPPVSTSDFKTHGPPISAAMARASLLLFATRDPGGSGIPCLPKRAFDSCS